MSHCHAEDCAWGRRADPQDPGRWTRPHRTTSRELKGLFISHAGETLSTNALPIITPRTGHQETESEIFWRHTGPVQGTSQAFPGEPRCALTASPAPVCACDMLSSRQGTSQSAHHTHEAATTGGCGPGGTRLPPG